MQQKKFTEGPLLGPLISFSIPVLLARLLQSMYGAVDLLIVGRFATSADVSAVATGAQIMMMITSLIAGLSMGTTVLLGQQIGQNRPKDSSRTIGVSIWLFAVVGLVITVALVLAANPFAAIMHAPPEAFAQTVSYVRICGIGSLVIVAYNLLGSVFRGVGDARTPLISVAIACVVNIAGDLLLVAGLGMGAAGAAIATVLAQGVSVVACLLLIRRQSLPFSFDKNEIRPEKKTLRRLLGLGIPLAIQDVLASVSFMIITSIVNSLGLIASAGMGVAEKVCGFVMLVPSSFSQALATIVAQNYGAGKLERARKALWIGIGLSLAAGAVMFAIAFFRGELLTGIFTTDADVVWAGADYLKAYAIDCLLTAFYFCFLGYFNGVGMTRFVMFQGILAAFAIRVPISYFMSLERPFSMFRIGLATPIASAVQVVLCLAAMVWVRKKSVKN